MVAVLNSVPIPLQDPISRPKRPQFGKEKDPMEGLVSTTWERYLTQQSQVLSQTPARVGVTVSLTNQNASIGATDMSGGTLSAGLYQIQYYARITTADGTSSSLTVTFDWTDGGVAPSYSGAAMTGDTTTTIQSGIILIRSDALSPIRYSTVYASNTPGRMKYQLYVTLSEILA
jgi:hypothetical protein